MNYRKILKKINQLKGHFSLMSDIELKNKTKEIKQRILLGESSTSIIVEAFSTVREADSRVLGLFPTDEQVLAALILYAGNIAEIKTGEGKSLIATMPIYLKALYMERAFLVTTNAYLVKRDVENIGRVYTWLGLTVADGSNGFNKFLKQSDEEENFKKKKKIYSSNIIYIDKGTLGFDFLFNTLAQKKENQFVLPLTFALLDEVDEILLDSAQQPLIISGAPKVQSNYFEMTNSIVQLLNENKDYKYDSQKNQVWLTEEGINKLKKFLSIEELLDQQFFSIYQHVILSLRANYTLKKNKDYIVEKGEVILLDKQDGRVLKGVKLQNGLHQAVEAKENVKLSIESETLSSITFQNLFRSFKQISGMSGTVKVAKREFIDTYNLDVKEIKSHKKNIRKDHKPRQYNSLKAKIKAVCEKIEELNSTGRPVLVVTGSVEMSELISLHLFNLGISHNLLNAKSLAKEAQIIKEAGGVGSVTVSTAMAGRGTDIKLSKEAIVLGGLAVVITEKLVNKRVELQAMGRAGRQGEPGDTYVFESLEDPLVRRYMQDKVQNYYDKNRSKNVLITNKRIQRCFNQAQRLYEEQALTQRERALQFDEILRLQKRKMEKSRKNVLELQSINQALALFKEGVRFLALEVFEGKGTITEKALRRFILDTIDYNYKTSQNIQTEYRVEEVVEYLISYVEKSFQSRKERINDDIAYLKFLKICMLKAIDTSWSEQVSSLDSIRAFVQSRGVAQKSPLLEFENEAKRSYDFQCRQVMKFLVKNIALSMLEIKKGQLTVIFP